MMAQSVETQVEMTLRLLKQKSTRRDYANLSRFGITAPNAFGVSMANVQAIAKRLGRSHELAAALWDTGWYEARMLTSFIDEPDRVTSAQMDRWCREFDNWAICDTLCFHLFDRTPFAWTKVAEWSRKNEEFQKRAAFALIASLALHDKHAADRQFLQGLSLIEGAATDPRNFVKKGVSWALRVVGRRNQRLNKAAADVARRLSSSPDPAASWIGRGALKELSSQTVANRLDASERKTKPSAHQPRKATNSKKRASASSAKGRSR